MSMAAEEIAAATSEIVDPMTGEVVSAVDADGLCEALARIQGEQARLRVAELAMRHALGTLAASETRTAKIVGRRFEARIERPGSTWDNSTLRRLWDEYPEARRYLRIERVAPAMREVAQLRKSNGPGVEAFRDALLAAEKPGSGAPTVKIVTLDKVDTSAIAAELEGLEW
jgi:hypothetical protein